MIGSHGLLFQNPINPPYDREMIDTRNSIISLIQSNIRNLIVHFDSIFLQDSEFNPDLMLAWEYGIQSYYERGENLKELFDAIKDSAGPSLQGKKRERIIKLCEDIFINKQKWNDWDEIESASQVFWTFNIGIPDAFVLQIRNSFPQVDLNILVDQYPFAFTLCVWGDILNGKEPSAKILSKGIRHESIKDFINIICAIVYMYKEVDFALERVNRVEGERWKGLAYKVRGLIHSRLSSFDLAISAYTKALEVNPRHAKTLAYRGECYYKLGKEMDKAINDFTQSIALDPGDPLVWEYRAVSYHLKGLYSFAIEDYQEVLKRDSKNPRVREKIQECAKQRIAIQMNWVPG